MSRQISAAAQAQAGAAAAAPFNVLELENPADRLPDGTVFWLFEEGSGDFAESNEGTAETRLLSYGPAAFRVWTDGRYGTAVAMSGPFSGTQKWGYVASPDTSVPVDGRTALTVAYWLKRGQWSASGPGPFSSSEGFRVFNNRTWISVPYKDGTTCGRVDKWLGGSGYSDDWQHWAFVIWVENGMVHCRAYLDGAAFTLFSDVHAADTVGRWGERIEVLAANNFLQTTCSLDELLIAPGWKASADDVAALYSRSLASRGRLFLSDARRPLSPGIETSSCVLDWGRVDLPSSPMGTQQDGPVTPLSEYSALIHLADDLVRSAFTGKETPAGRPARLYQFWEEPSLSWPEDSVLLYEGVLGSVAGGPAADFREEDASLRLRLIDRFKDLLDRGLGVRASRETFPQAPPEHEGRPLPLAYGRAGKVRAVCVKGPRRGRLMQGCSASDTVLYVEGGEDFPQGVPVTVRIDREYLRGTFQGNVFSVQARGAGPSADGSFLRFTCAGHKAGADGRKDFRRILVSDPAGMDDQYAGMWLGAPVGSTYSPGEVTFRAAGPPNPFALREAPSNAPRDGRQWRQILRYDAAEGLFEVNLPFLREGERSLSPDDRFLAMGTQVLLGSGTELEVGTLPAPHAAGAEVSEVLDEYIYVLNAAPSRKVKALFFRGLKGEWRLPSDFLAAAGDAGGGILGAFTAAAPGGLAPDAPSGLGAFPMTGGAWAGASGAVFPSRENGFQEIPSRFYSVNLSDTSWSAGTGTALTTVSLKMLPEQVPFFRPENLEIWADLEGVPADDGSLIENPSDVIRDILTGRLGLDASLLDDASFSGAAAGLSQVRFAGVFEAPGKALEVLSEAAFQARCRLRFEDGKIFLDLLSNGSGQPVSPPLDASAVEADSLRLRWESPSEVVNELEFSWRGRDGQRRSDRVREEASAAEFGRRPLRGGPAHFSLLDTREQARRTAEFWVRRWAWPWRRASVEGFLPLLPLQRGDPVSVDLPEWGLSSQPAEVLGVEHRPGSARAPDRIRLDLRLPVRSGCASSCEAACETGCESSCETWCQTACELSCETACESACQALCELACQSAAEADRDLCLACEVGNRVAVAQGAGPCDLAAEGWLFQCAACQVCQAGCVSSCQSGCEAACEQQYMSNDCDASCIVSGCETACQVSCEPGCESGCEVSCEVPCEIYCETGCVSTCQSACQSACQACEACETGCVSSCRAGCEVSCEPSHTSNACDASCIAGNCEVACIVGGCEVSCEAAWQ